MIYRRSVYIVQALFAVAIGTLIGICVSGQETIALAEDGTPPELRIFESDGKKDASDNDHGMPRFPQSGGGPDQFGYTWSDTSAYTWLASPIDSGLTGDDKVVEIPIGFDFPFYENTYNALYASTNGLITFGIHSFSFQNIAMPFLVEPQNLIAPLWDDLWIPTNIPEDAKLSYDNTNPDYFVVSWEYAARYPNKSDFLTFQAILYKNGNICTQYKDLNGVLSQASVGIEDIYGLDGLTYLHNAPGLDALEGTRRLCFFRPAPGYRAKINPTYRSGFIKNGQASFALDVMNAGDVGVDTYELRVELSDPFWVAHFLDAFGQPLPDADGDGRYETESVASGGKTTVRVTLNAPSDALIGENVVATIKVTSQNSADIEWEATMHAAVPTSFVQGLVVDNAISMVMVWEQNQYFPTIATGYTGSTIGITYLPGDRYLYLWEQNYIDQDASGRDFEYTDIEFAVLNGFGNIDEGTGKFSNNREASTYDYQIIDRSPVGIVREDGHIGLVWIRTIENDDGDELCNVYFSVYDLADLSVPVVPPTNVTENMKWSDSAQLDVPDYFKPRITLVNNGDFAVTWVDDREQSGGGEKNIGFAIYTVAGQKNYFTEKIAAIASAPGDILYGNPSIVGLSDNRIFLSFVREDDFAVTSSIGYMVLGINGDVIHAPQLIPGIQGTSPVSFLFDSGPIFLGWLNPIGTWDARQITFAILDSSSLDILSGPTELETPNFLSAELLSASQTLNGKAVVTWIDSDMRQSIYYALIGSNGAVLTPAMRIYEAVGKTITVSKVGASSAAYIGKSAIYLPIIAR